MKYLYVISFLSLWSCNTEETKITPVFKDITESIYTSTTVQPDSLYKVYSSVQGILETQFVEEGAKVDKGTAIAQIKNTASSIQMSNDGLSFTLSQQQLYGNTSILKTLQNDIKSTQLKVNNDSINYHRQERLWNNKIGSKATFENKKLAYELSQTNLESLKKKYDMTQMELETQMKQAGNKYKNSTASSQDFKICSEISGTVYAFYKNTGEIINTLEPIALIGSNELFIIEMLVDEKDIVKVKIGQSVRILLDAYDDLLFIATVSKIYPKKDERTQTFLIEALFNDQPSILYPGLTGEGNIIIGQKKEALVIPRSYLVQKNQVLTEDGLVNVITGLETMEYVEILSGLSSQTIVLKKEE